MVSNHSAGFKHIIDHREWFKTVPYYFAGATGTGETGAAVFEGIAESAGLAVVSAAFGSGVGTISEVGGGVSIITSSFLANKKERRRENTIKEIAITLVALVRTSALEEPNAVWLAPPIIPPKPPPLPACTSTNNISKKQAITKKTKTVPIKNPIVLPIS
jgi:hypothetical protein